MEKLNPWVMGTALSITFVAVYALCAAAFAIAPKLQPAAALTGVEA